MANAAAQTMTAVHTVQTALSVIASLGLTQFQYPPDCTLTDKASYDYIIVGGGSAGCALANRLSANSSVNVLLIEAGTYPPWHSEVPYMFPPMPKTEFDYDISSVNDNYTAQNLQDSVVSLTLGKMLGGSSNINHMIHVQGDPHDFNNWASMLGDDSWSYENVLPDFKKLEHLTDKDLLASDFVNLHGTDGMLKIEREISVYNNNYLKAFEELGHRIVEDTTSRNSSLGASNPLFNIYNDKRQSNSLGYLAPAKNRTNLCIALSTTATKIIIKDNVAVGVQVNSSSGETLNLYANKEVIVSAGAIHTPKLLMLSGIGPKSHLEANGIEVVADLPVGQNLMYHPPAVLLITMESDTSTTPAVNPYIFPVPTTTLYAALDSAQTYPDYQAITLLFGHDSAALLQLCANCFKYSDDICNKFAAANVGKTVLFVVHNLMMPNSRGNVTLASTDPADEPVVYLGTYSDNTDLELMANSLADFIKVLETSYFKENNASLVDIGLCSNLNGTEFWKCYALAMSATMWHYSGTCAMGNVVDSNLCVKGVDRLRVADASVMPTLVSGNINAAVTMIGERCASLILNK